VAADFTRDMALPAVAAVMTKIGFSPGSMLGNFTPVEAVRFVSGACRMLGAVTARFNKTLLVRVTRKLAGDFYLAPLAYQSALEFAIFVFTHL
jgi:uncharacterized SAM-dependent methyltransferase